MFLLCLQYNGIMFFMKKILFIVLVMTCVALPQVSRAQLEFLDGYEDKYIAQDIGPSAEKEFSFVDNSTASYVYETPTVKALSHLFWAVNLYSLDDDKAVDEFMHHNECEIYRNFSSDEFEWSEIRNATRDFIRENKNDFPTRFEFIIPIKLEDYDSKRKAFEVQEKYKISSIRRFEVYATNFRQKACAEDIRIQEGYPRSLVLEFSRPFSLSHVPMSEDLANEYIKSSIEKLKRYDPGARVKSRMYSLRDAYLVLKVKIFTHGKFLGLTSYKIPAVQMLSILEGYEVYEDRYKQKLFYAESYVTNKDKGKLNVKLQDEYDILIERSKGKGLLHKAI